MKNSPVLPNYVFKSLIFCLILLAGSCSRLPSELTPSRDQQINLLDAQEAYIKQFQEGGGKLDTKNPKLKRRLEWAGATPYLINGTTKYAVPISLENELYFKNADNTVTKYSDVSFLIVSLKDGKYAFEVLTKIPAQNLPGLDESKENKFSGTVIIENIFGEADKGFVTRNNKTYFLRDTPTSDPNARVYCEVIDWYSCVSSDGRVTWTCDPVPINTETHCYDDGTGNSTSNGGSTEGYGNIGSSRGFSGVPTSNPWSVGNQGPTYMCAPRTVTRIGAYFYAELSQVGVSAINYDNGDIFNVDLVTSCFKVYAYDNNVDAARAGILIKQAVNTARKLTEYDLQQYTAPLTPADRRILKINFERYVDRALNMSNPYSHFSSGNCQGNVPTEQAGYECNLR